MAFGKKQPQSYGVPVRRATPRIPEQANQQQPQAPVPAPAGVYAPVTAMPMNAQFTPPAPPVSAIPYTGGQQSWSPAPTGFAPAPPGFPAYPTAAKSHVARNVILAVGGILGVLVVLAVAIPMFLSSRPAPELPATLAGRPRSTDPAAESALATLKDQNPGRKVDAAVYTGTNQLPELVVVVSRGRTDTGKEIKDLESEGMIIDAGSSQKFGDMTCGRVTAGQLVFCVWSDDVSGVVIQYLSDDLAPTAAIAAVARNSVNG